MSRKETGEITTQPNYGVNHNGTLPHSVEEHEGCIRTLSFTSSITLRLMTVYVALSQQLDIFHVQKAIPASISCVGAPAPEATPPVRLLDGSNIELKIRSLGLIPSNIQPNYQMEA